MRKLIMLFSFLMVVGIGTGIAQTRELKGTVIEKGTNAPLPGVTVQVKGTTSGVSTDMDGRFSLKVKDSDVLIISFVGMKTLTIPVGTQSTLNLTMESDSRDLEEVVVVAYGVQRKEAVTGAVSNVSAKKLEAVTVTSLDKALQGNAAGVVSTSANGSPGSAATVMIRGAGSITAGTSPLYVIDGIPMMSGKTSAWSTSSNALSSLNPADIESMSILKDAAATSIYGSQAANGVVLITTKKGRSGKTKINFNMEQGFSRPSNTSFGMCSSEELLMLQRESVDNAREYYGNREFDWTNPKGIYYLPDELANNNTDWWDLVTRSGGYQSYDLSMSGGNEKTKFFVSASYMDQEGIVKATDFSRFSARLNLDHKISEKFIFNTNLAFSQATQTYVSDGWGYENPVAASYWLLPYDAPYNEDGSVNESLSWNSNGNYNPMSYLKNVDKGQKTKSLISTSFLQYNIMPWLNVRTTFGIDWKNTRDRQYWSEESKRAKDDGLTSIYSTDQRFYTWTSSTIANFNKTFADVHSVDALVGYEVNEYNYDWLEAGGKGATDDIPYLSAASKDFQVGDGIEDNAGISYLARVNYSYNGLYYVSGSFRRDGSSKFGADSRWANFWSASAAWKLSGEKFLKDVEWINLLKVRASYGTTGNSSISSYASKGVYGTTRYGGISGLAPSQIGNPDLAWEKSATTNLAIDFGFLDRINGSVEYFWKKTSDLLLRDQLSFTTGFNDITRNMGSVMNRGFEFQASAAIFRDTEVKWNTELNFTLPSSEILDLGGATELAEGAYQMRRVGGKSFTEWYLKESAGVNPANGMAMWYDKSGNVTENYSDARFAYMGSPEPTVYGGWTNTVSWKGISLSFMFFVNYGNKVKFNDRYYTESDGANGFAMNTSREQLKRWQKPGDITDVPKPIYGNPSGSREWSTSRWLEDGSYIRLKNVSLTYDLPKPLLSKIGINNLSVYFKGTNLWTYSKVNALDPEVNVYGNVSNVYPNSSSYIFGISLGI